MLHIGPGLPGVDVAWRALQVAEELETSALRSDAAKELGHLLFKAVFSGEIMLAWFRSERLARAEGAVGIRLRLRVDASSIARLPWELLYDRRSRSFIARSYRGPR